jgi:hypothetical protein
MEGLTRHIDGYCERVDFTYWSEPLNAVSNVAFLIAAFVMWQRVRGQRLVFAEILCALAALIGIGSWLLHTHATIWGAIADTVPIMLFILLGTFLINFHFLGLSKWMAIFATLAFIPYTIAMTLIFLRLPFFDISAGYWPVPLMIAIYAYLLRHPAPATSRGLVYAAIVISVSLVFRSLDMPLCAHWPYGTHVFWHMINGVFLAGVIELYYRHMLATRAAGG